MGAGAFLNQRYASSERQGVRVVALAPAIAFALSTAQPADADGEVLCQIFAGDQGNKLDCPGE